MKIADCHLHFIDAKENDYPHFNNIDPGFVELVGDYSSLPRKYLLAEYLKDSKGFNVDKIVAAEFVTSDPLNEAKWLQLLQDRTGKPDGAIALADPLSSQFETLLKEYSRLPIVRAVRAHLLYDEKNPLKRFAPRGKILLEKEWRNQFGKLQKYDFGWEFELFAHQIPEAEDLAKAFPKIRMALHPMGWPLDQSSQGFAGWKKHMRSMAVQPNVIVKITAIGCIFPKWSLEEIRPWIREAIEIFGPERSMFGSHMPIEKLESGFAKLYDAYFEIVKDLSAQEQQRVFHDTAVKFYQLPSGTKGTNFDTSGI